MEKNGWTGVLLEDYNKYCVGKWAKGQKQPAAVSKEQTSMLKKEDARRLIKLESKLTVVKAEEAAKSSPHSSSSVHIDVNNGELPGAPVVNARRARADFAGELDLITKCAKVM